jgi:CRISPR-associated protein Cas5h
VSSVDCLEFRAKGAYGQFRKPYTTTSALTFLCIPPIAVKGLIGAVLGITRAELHESTLNMKVGIRVLSPVRKDMQSVKLTTMKVGDSSATGGLFNFPSNVEFLRDLEYDLSIAWNADKLDELEARLINRAPVFTPCLGVTEHVAKLDFTGRFDAFIIQEADRVDSVVPTRFLTNVQFSNYDIFIDDIPVSNNEKREYTGYEKVIFAFKDGKSCGLKGSISGEIYRVGDNNVFFF